MKKTLLLIILDGWGIGRENESNPIYLANPQRIKQLEKEFPATSLQASGISVGLPWGEIGNSEVGHLTIGAGKVVYQHFPRITLAIRDGSFFKNPVFKEAFNHARLNNSRIHFVGLLTQGNVHASLEHLLALVQMAEQERIEKIGLQLFSDGKDISPRTAKDLLKKIPGNLLVSLMGRYYAMDREERWQLTEQAYKVLTGQAGIIADDPQETIEAAYKQNMSDEFIPPIRLKPEEFIRDNDAVIFFNFREDGIRQLAESFILEDFDKFPVKKFRNLYLATFTQYEERFTAPVAFPLDHVTKPLGKILADSDKNQLRIAETNKYAHVTYFFNGYREKPFHNEYRVLIPSLQIAHIDEQPEMRASLITDRLLQVISEKSFDFVLANYANPDLIAHTGNFQAALSAVKVIDEQADRLVKAVLAGENAIMIITSDHGNLERMFDPLTGRSEAQHDSSPVPFYLIGKNFYHRRFINSDNLAFQTTGILADVAPTILELMGLSKPEQMTGRSLLDSLI